MTLAAAAATHALAMFDNSVERAADWLLSHPAAAEDKKEKRDGAKETRDGGGGSRKGVGGGADALGRVRALSMPEIDVSALGGSGVSGDAASSGSGAAVRHSLSLSLSRCGCVGVGVGVWVCVLLLLL